MQLWAALGYTRLALLFRLYDIPLVVHNAATDQLISRQVSAQTINIADSN